MSRNKKQSKKLLNAAVAGDITAVNEAIKAGADINYAVGFFSPYISGTTPLILAARNGHKEIVDTLIHHGASLHLKNESGDAKTCALRSSKFPVVEAIIKAEKNIALLAAVEKGQLTEAKDALDQGANIDTTIKRQTFIADCTPLIIASNEGHAEMVKLLIDRGANIHLRASNNSNALMCAAKASHPEIVRILIDAGIDLYTKNNISGETALDFAKTHDKQGIIIDLIERALKQKEEQLKNPITNKTVQEAKSQTGNNNNQSWEIMGDDILVHTVQSETTRLRISQIFNFSSREKITRTENITTNTATESSAKAFTHMEEQELQKAFNIFKSKGGSADESYVFKGIKVVKTSPNAS